MSDAITPTTAEMLDEILTSRLIDVHTALPGTVTLFNILLQTVNVELGVRRILQTEAGGQVSEDLPILQNVPVGQPRNNDFYISFPIKSGDTGMVFFTEASMDQWRSKGGVTSPGDDRRHSLTGAIFMPCLVPTLKALTPVADVDASALVVGTTSGGEIKLGGGLAAEPMVLGTAFGLEYAAHVHASPFGPTGITAPLTPASFSTKIKGLF